jgi:hypothetical protein
LFVVQRQHPETHWFSLVESDTGQPVRRRVGHEVEVRCSAPDDDTEAHHGVGTVSEGRLGDHGKLKCAGDADESVVRPGRVQNALSAGDEAVRDRVVP